VKWNGTAVATPTTAGVPRVDVKAMEASVLTATAIASDAITAAKIAPGAIDLATFAADALLSAFGIADSGTARAGGTSTTLKLALTASASDDRYLNGVVLITGGTGAGQINQVDDYTGATQTAAMKLTWATTPDATSTYVDLRGRRGWDCAGGGNRRDRRVGRDLGERDRIWRPVPRNVLGARRPRQRLRDGDAQLQVDGRLEDATHRRRRRGPRPDLDRVRGPDAVMRS
jgi:hypothetical protein